MDRRTRRRRHRLRRPATESRRVLTRATIVNTRWAVLCGGAQGRFFHRAYCVPSIAPRAGLGASVRDASGPTGSALPSSICKRTGSEFQHQMVQHSCGVTAESARAGPEPRGKNSSEIFAASVTKSQNHRDSHWWKALLERSLFWVGRTASRLLIRGDIVGTIVQS